jgi:hypothetical protein
MQNLGIYLNKKSKDIFVNTLVVIISVLLLLSLDWYKPYILKS